MSESVSARPPASARYSEGRISSSPALMTSPVPVLVCIGAEACDGPGAAGYRPVNGLF